MAGPESGLPTGWKRGGINGTKHGLNQDMSDTLFEEWFKALYIKRGFVSSKDELREAWMASAEHACKNTTTPSHELTSDQATGKPK